MGKEELFRNPLHGLGAAPAGRLSGVPRASAMSGRCGTPEQVLEHGQVLGMFPEGTRSQGQGPAARQRPAQPGWHWQAKCPILPVALHGPQYMFRRFPKRTTVRMRFGDPICPEDGDTPLSLTDRLMFALAELLPPEARGAYRYRPAGF